MFDRFLTRDVTTATRLSVSSDRSRLEATRTTSSPGFLGMFGGMLFGLLVIVWPLLVDECSAMAGAKAMWSMITPGLG